MGDICDVGWKNRLRFAVCLSCIIFLPYMRYRILDEHRRRNEARRACCLHHVLKYGLDNLDQEKLTEMLTFANAAASIITTRKGALRVMPEVEAFLKKLLKKLKKRA